MFSEVLDLRTCVPTTIKLDPEQNYTDSFFEYFRFLQAEDIKHRLLNLNPNRSKGQKEEVYDLPDG